MSKKNIIRIKNSGGYIHKPEPNVGGDKKDFFYGDDLAFARHKAELINKTSEISNEIRSRENKSFATLKISLKDEAIAKSHRPTNALFNHKHPVIGGGEIGELYVQANEKSLPTLVERLSQAKVKSDVKFDNKGEIVSKVGALRSEVSAIADISLYTGNDKSSLSEVEFTKEIIENKNSIIVELFIPKNTDTLDSNKINELKKDFISHLESKNRSLKLNKESRFFQDNIISISLEDSKAYDILPLINELKSNPLVKSYYPSPIMVVSKEAKNSEEKIKNFPRRSADTNYPKVILVDKGIRSNILSEWVVERSDALGDIHLNEYHADEMASILIGSKFLNKNLECLENDGCDIYDIWIPSNKYTFSDHFEDLSEYSDWLYLEIQAARELGYRIISMSINFQQLASAHEYSFLASRIDEISSKLDVIFVISVGNLDEKYYRKEWPNSENDVFKMLARYQEPDKILIPADSVSSLSVGSVNHIDNKLITYQAPTRYTRRGPATSYGIKPDVVHIGGIGDTNNSCFCTLDGLNKLKFDSHGTSLSAPHIAKILANIDMKSNETLSKTSLKALMIHNSSVPACLSSKTISKEARDFVGFGFPINSQDMITKDETSFTFVFEGVLSKGQVGEFNFTWPKSLATTNGKCRGKIKMTLVYSPPIDRQFGQEYIRANVDASLQQQKIKNNIGTFGKAVNSIWDIKLGEDSNFEKNLIEQGFKWWPSKAYERLSKGGFGNSTNWRLRVTSQVRDSMDYPAEGIKFSVIVTVEDPSGKSLSVYNEMRQELVTLGAEIEDITIRDEIRI
ncbi:TPA: S8 family serine peptidase [Yersinia enterocolitica]